MTKDQQIDILSDFVAKVAADKTLPFQFRAEAQLTLNAINEKRQKITRTVRNLLTLKP